MVLDLDVAYNGEAYLGVSVMKVINGSPPPSHFLWHLFFSENMNRYLNLNSDFQNQKLGALCCGGQHQHMKRSKNAPKHEFRCRLV